MCPRFFFFFLFVEKDQRTLAIAVALVLALSIRNYHRELLKEEDRKRETAQSRSGSTVHQYSFIFSVNEKKKNET